MIHTSTSEVYGTAKYIPIDELHPLQPQSPYSATKIGADAMVMSLHKSISLPVVIARPFNCYGPRQSARAIIPSIITQVLSKKNEIIVGNLKPTRDFTYVTDTCDALIKLAKIKSVIGEIINIGSNKEISIRNIFNKITKITSSKSHLKIDSERIRPKKSEVQRLVCDNRKIKKLINYKPKINFDTGLNLTIQWFKKEKNKKLYKPDIYNI